MNKFMFRVNDCSAINLMYTVTTLTYIKKLTQVYSHHPREKIPDAKGFLLNWAKDLFICDEGVIMTGCSS